MEQSVFAHETLLCSFESQQIPKVTSATVSVQNLNNMMAQTVTASMYFLSREALYEKEKPYYLDYYPPNNFPRSNAVLEKFDELQIEDIRDELEDLSLSENGFFLAQIDSALTYDDFDDNDKIAKVYLKEVADTLIQKLGASRVQIYDFIVSSTVCRVQYLIL